MFPQPETSMQTIFILYILCQLHVYMSIHTRVAETQSYKGACIKFRQSLIYPAGLTVISYNGYELYFKITRNQDCNQEAGKQLLKSLSVTYTRL